MMTTGTRADGRQLLEAVEELPAVHVGEQMSSVISDSGCCVAMTSAISADAACSTVEALRLELHANQLGGLVVVLDDQCGARVAMAGSRASTIGIPRDGVASTAAGGRQRQPHGEARALAHRALHRDGAAVQLGEQLHHREAESRALELSRDRPLSIWLNGLNSCSSPSGEMPMPLSVTLISRNSSKSLSSASGKLRPAHAPDSLPTSTARHARGAQRHLARPRR